MKWRKETQAYMWANYYSEDGEWRAWDEDKVISGGGRNKVYSPKLKKMVKTDAIKHIWKLQNLKSGDVLPDEFKTLKAIKEFVEG